VTEAAVPKGGGVGGGDQGVEDDTGGGVRVEVTRTIAPENYRLGIEVLHRETSRVKFKGDTIITSELSNRD
jgi:hypothetical protein